MRRPTALNRERLPKPEVPVTASDPAAHTPTSRGRRMRRPTALNSERLPKPEVPITASDPVYFSAAPV